MLQLLLKNTALKFMAEKVREFIGTIGNWSTSTSKVGVTLSNQIKTLTLTDGYKLDLVLTADNSTKAAMCEGKTFRFCFRDSTGTPYSDADVYGLYGEKVTLVYHSDFNSFEVTSDIEGVGQARFSMDVYQ